MITRTLFRHLPKLGLAAATVLCANVAGAQSCNDGYIFCTNYGYQCSPGGCTVGYCCAYACVRPTPPTVT